MTRFSHLLLTSLAPVIWGSSYIVTTELLANLDPLTISLLRALPAGLVLLLVTRKLPRGIWIPKMLVLGALNFSIFWSLLFLAAYRLPGGIAAIMGALQPLIVIFAARILLHDTIRPLAILAVFIGICGVSLIVLMPTYRLDTIGMCAGILGSASMATGTVLSRKWHPPVSALTFTSWQLVAGGVLLLPFFSFTETSLSALTTLNLLGLGYLGFIGAGLTYILWLRGLQKLDPTAISLLGFLSPLSAILLGWAILGETLNLTQLSGCGLTLAGLAIGQYAQRPGQKRHLS